ncbi:hypothetical protein T03_10549 [Trichinella britovi]|uniref:Uncharacterized protein n=1 Tax=Trichinella britovi TaxID=45882 RepID=A0A0V1AL27_TRIBR|nr:hypothetical protein T03_10549 [Trichinella britovi]
MNSFYHCCGIEYPEEYDEHAKRLAELTDISILFMQADLEIHFSHDRLRVHSQLAKMDENILLVVSCKKGLSVWASGVRTLDVSLISD